MNKTRVPNFITPSRKRAHTHSSAEIKPKVNEGRKLRAANRKDLIKRKEHYHAWPCLLKASGFDPSLTDAAIADDGTLARPSPEAGAERART
jgi:hypothetical protein